MRWARWAFDVMAVLLLVDIVLLALLSPARNDPGFWIMLPLTFGALFVWAGWIAVRLRRGAGIAAALAFLGVLTALVVVGATIQLSIGSEPGPPVIPALAVARLATGAWVVVAWAAVIRAWWERTASVVP